MSTFACDDCQELLIEHLHDELDHRTRRRVHEHLGECPECATARCRLHAEFEEIRDAHQVELPAALNAKVLERAEREFSKPSWLRVLPSLRRPVPAYAALLAAMVPLAFFAGRLFSGGPGVATAAPVPVNQAIQPALTLPGAPAAQPATLPQPNLSDYDASEPPEISTRIL